MVFKGLSIHIARFHNQSRTGGGLNIEINTCAGTSAENGRGAYMRAGAYLRDTTVLDTHNFRMRYSKYTVTCAIT